MARNGVSFVSSKSEQHTTKEKQIYEIHFSVLLASIGPGQCRVILIFHGDTARVYSTLSLEAN